MQVSKGVLKKAVKAVIYGVEGIGKSTLASYAPAPLYVDLDKGTARLDVERVEGIADWSGLLSLMQEFAHGGHPYQTLVIDTADKAAAMCEKFIISARVPGKKSIEDIAYGKGYKMLAEEFSQFLAWCDVVVDAGYNVVIIAHAVQRSVTQPDTMAAYDHWELKLPGNSTNKLGPLLKEWADLVLFCSYKLTLVSAGSMGEKKKAVGGERVMYTTHTPYADAKNRFGLDAVLPLSFEPLAPLFPQHASAAKPSQDAEKFRVIGELRKLTEQKGAVSLDQVRDTLLILGILQKGQTFEDLDAAFIQTQLIDKWESFSRVVVEKVPF